jgi:orotate phosphoribosyltransferase-like protein
MNFKYYNEIIDKIVALKQQDIGSRQIAKQLNIGKSTVNQYYKFWLEQNNIINLIDNSG